MAEQPITEAFDAAPAADNLRPPLILDPRDPLPSAREFVDIHYHDHGQRLLHHHRGVFREWCGGAWPVADDAAVRAALWKFLETAQKPNDKPFQPNRARVGDALDALRAVTNLPAEIDPPAWLDTIGDPPPPNEIVAVANGLGIPVPIT